MYEFSQPSMAVAQKLFLTDEKEILRKGTVELRPIRVDKFKEPRITFRCWKDAETDLWYGIPVGKNPDGTYKFRSITIIGHRFFHLENMQDALDWHIIQHHECVKGSKFAKGEPLFMVNDLEMNAEKDIERAEMSQDAISYILGLNGLRLAEFGRLYGIDPVNNSPSVIKQQLLEIAKTKPRSITEKRDAESETEIHIVVKRAIATGLIKHSIDRGYVYRDGLPMGGSEKAIIEMLRKDLAMFANIDAESKAKDTISKRHAEGAKSESVQDKSDKGVKLFGKKG